MHHRDEGAAAGSAKRADPDPRPTHHRLCLAVFVAVAFGASAGAARAERWWLDPSIDTRATWTDNPLLVAQPDGSDTILEVSPRLGLRGEGKRFRIAGNVGLTALTYVNGTGDNRYLPSVDLVANLEAIERFFFIEGAVGSRQTAENAFGPSPVGAADVNTATSTQYRLVPSFQGRLGSNVDYQLRSANSWTDVSGNGANAGGAYLGEHVLRIEQKPRPFGWAFEGGRNETRFETGEEPSAVVDSARLIAKYAFSPEFDIGLRGGYEKTNIVIENDTEVIYGAEFTWKPSERTDMNGFWENRYFGSGWRFAFTHRRPRVAWNIGLSRDVTTSPQQFLTVPATNDLTALLDAAFTTRFPDPTERARVVSDLMARQGLPNTLSAEARLFANRVSLVTSATASMTLIGVRNSLAFAIFSSKSEEVLDSIFAGGGASTNVEQQGVTVTFTHQVSAVTSLNTTVAYSRSRGVGADTGNDSKQKTAQAQVTRQLAPKTSAFAGVRVQKFDSNVPGITTGADETAAFVGLAHRF